MKTERNNRRALITRKINHQIRVALRDIGASKEEVKRIPTMAADELHDLRNKLKADPYLDAYIGSWGDTLTDHEVFECLQQWNVHARAAWL